MKAGYGSSGSRDEKIADESFSTGKLGKRPCFFSFRPSCRIRPKLRDTRRLAIPNYDLSISPLWYNNDTRLRIVSTRNGCSWTKKMFFKECSEFPGRNRTGGREKKWEESFDTAPVYRLHVYV